MVSSGSGLVSAPVTRELSLHKNMHLENPEGYIFGVEMLMLHEITVDVVVLVVVRLLDADVSCFQSLPPVAGRIGCDFVLT